MRMDTNWLEFPCGTLIDLSKVIMVSPVGGDPAWLRYTIYLQGGYSLDVYEKRRYSEVGSETQMPRAEFIARLKQCTVVTAK